MPKPGVITGNEIFKDVDEQIAKVNAGLIQVTKTYTELQNQIRNAKSVSEANKAAQEAARLSREQAALDRDRIKIEAEKQRLIKATAQAQKAVNQANKASGQASKSNLAQFQRLNSAYQQQSRLLADLRRQYKDYQARQLQGVKLTKQETQRMKELGRQVKQLDRDLKRIDASAGQFQRSVGNYSNALGGFTRNFRSFLGAFGLTSGIFLFAQTLQDAFRITREFDQAQADLAAILGKNKEDIGALTTQAKFLGSTTAFTATQVSNLQLELSKLGFAEDEILKATKGVEDLAIATGVDAARAAKLAGASLRGFTLDAEESDRVAAALAVSTTRSANSFSTLEVALPKVAAIANDLNFSIEETVALLGQLQNAGFESSIAGTSLRQILAQISKEGTALSNALGGPVKGFDNLQKVFRELTDDAGKFEKVLNIVPVRARAAFSVLVKAADDTELLKDQITDVNDELAILADTKLDSLEGDLTLLRSAWEGFVLSIEEGTGPIAQTFRDLTQGVTKLLNGLTDLNKGFGTRIDEAALRGPKVAAEALEQELRGVNKEQDNYAELQKEAAEKLIPRYKKIVKELGEEFSTLTRKQGEANLFEGFILGFQGIEKDINDIGAKKSLFQAAIKELEAIANGITPNEDDAKKGGAEFVENTIAGIREKLKDARKELENAEIGSAEFFNAQASVQRYEARIKELTRTQKSAARGTIEFFQNEIKRLKDLQKEVATTSQEYADLQGQILQNEEKIRGIRGDDLFQPQGIVRGEVEFGTDENALPDLVPESAVIAAQRRAEVVKALQEEMKDDLFATLNEFSQYYDLDLKAFQNLFDSKKNTLDDYAQAAKAIGDFIFQNTIESYEKEIIANQSKLDAILNNENASDEQKRIAREKFDKQESILKQKQFKAEQNALIFRVLVDTASKVAQILTTAAALAANPITAAFAPGAFAQAKIAAGFGAAQVAFIKAQKVPEFYTGKELHDRFEGAATWGERRREVLIDENGNVSISPNKKTPLWVKKNDIIVKSLPEYQRRIQDPNDDVYKRVNKSVTNEHNSRQQRINVMSSMDLGPLKGMLQQEIRNGFRNIQIRPTVINKFDQPFNEY